jgi:hypothetical protein
MAGKEKKNKGGGEWNLSLRTAESGVWQMSQ